MVNLKKALTFISTMLTVVMLAVSVSAAPANDAYTIYSKAQKQMENATSMEMSGNMKITMEIDGESLVMNTSIKTAQVNRKDGSFEMKLEMKEKDLGISSATYYKNGYMYQNSGGVKTKAKVGFEEAMMNSFEMETDLTKDMLKDATVEKLDSGNYRLKLVISAEEMNRVMGGDISSVMSELVEDDIKIKISDINYYMDVDSKGNPKAVRMAFSANMKMSDVSVKCKYIYNFKVTSINKITSIKLPSDISSYKAA